MKHLLKTAFLFSLLMTLLVACKKEDDTKDKGPTGITGPTGTTTCRITQSVSGYNGSTTGSATYIYDSQKRVIRYESNTVAGSYGIFTYNSNSINIKNYNSDTVTSEGNGTLNSAGQVIEMSYGVNNQGTYTYDSDGRLIKMVGRYANNYIDSTVYELQGGNLIKSTHATTNGSKYEITYTYYTDKPGQNIYPTSELFSGKPTTNLVKSQTMTILAPTPLSPSTTNFSYEYDNDGKVTRITNVSGVNTYTNDNTYTCN